MVSQKEMYKSGRRSRSRTKSPSRDSPVKGKRTSKSPAPKAARGKSPKPMAALSPRGKADKSWAMDKSEKSWRDVGGALFLIVAPALAVIILTYGVLHEDGSLQKLLGKIWREGVIGTLLLVHPSVSEMLGAMQVVLVFWVGQIIMMPLVPGPLYVGPVSPSGMRPVYKANGVATYLLTCFLWAAGSYMGFFKAGVFYDVAAPMYAALSYFSIVFCVFLYVKGLYYPSTKDSGSTGSVVFDFFWGTELYPRVGHSLWSIGWDIKQFTNCRWGMMVWMIAVFSFAAKQYELYGKISDTMFVSVLVQFVYILKFFWWETGYFNTMDIQHDRAGWYICWGCLVWVPCLYTLHTLFLVENVYNMGAFTAAFMGAAGVVSVYINWDADMQKIIFRNSGGDCLIWGKPAEKIVATYQTTEGETKQSLLLVSGWWGVSRHFHYLPELAAAFCWSFPTLMSGNILGFTYWIFLALLLTDRSIRDEGRCQTKYGKYWTEYKKRVPYKIIPYVM